MKYRLQNQFKLTMSKISSLKEKNIGDFDLWNTIQPFYCNELSLCFGMNELI